MVKVWDPYLGQEVEVIYREGKPSTIPLEDKIYRIEPISEVAYRVQRIKPRAHRTHIVKDLGGKYVCDCQWFQSGHSFCNHIKAVIEYKKR